MKLSTLAVSLGVLFSIPQVYGLVKPAEFGRCARRFPRSVNWGYFLMGLGTIWFLWNVNTETISDFADYKKAMLIGFGAVGLLTCLYVREFLAVRGLAVVLLLLAKLMLDTARWNASEWRLVISVLAYIWIVLAMWFMVSPWRMRDLIQWATADSRRIRVGSAIRLAVFVLVILLGLTVY